MRTQAVSPVSTFGGASVAGTACADASEGTATSFASSAKTTPDIIIKKLKSIKQIKNLFIRTSLKK
jgi:hypothetical protein